LESEPVAQGRAFGNEDPVSLPDHDGGLGLRFRASAQQAEAVREQESDQEQAGPESAPKKKLSPRRGGGVSMHLHVDPDDDLARFSIAGYGKPLIMTRYSFVFETVWALALINQSFGRYYPCSVELTKVALDLPAGGSHIKASSLLEGVSHGIEYIERVLGNG
jgi:hypothetical protein